MDTRYTWARLSSHTCVFLRLLVWHTGKTHRLNNDLYLIFISGVSKDPRLGFTTEAFRSMGYIISSGNLSVPSTGQTNCIRVLE